jgi:hypothetical protein
MSWNLNSWHRFVRSRLVIHGGHFDSGVMSELSRQFAAMADDERAGFQIAAAGDRARARIFDEEIQSSEPLQATDASTSLWGLGSWDPEYPVSSEILDERQSECKGFLAQSAVAWDSMGEVLKSSTDFEDHRSTSCCGSISLECLNAAPPAITTKAKAIRKVLLNIVNPHGVPTPIQHKLMIRCRQAGCRGGVCAICCSTMSGQAEFILCDIVGTESDDGQILAGSSFRMQPKLFPHHKNVLPYLITETDIALQIARAVPTLEHLVYEKYDSLVDGFNIKVVKVA